MAFRNHRLMGWTAFSGGNSSTAGKKKKMQTITAAARQMNNGWSAELFYDME